MTTNISRFTVYSRPITSYYVSFYVCISPLYMLFYTTKIKPTSCQEQASTSKSQASASVSPFSLTPPTIRRCGLSWAKLMQHAWCRKRAEGHVQSVSAGGPTLLQVCTVTGKIMFELGWESVGFPTSIITSTKLIKN